MILDISRGLSDPKVVVIDSAPFSMSAAQKDAYEAIGPSINKALSMNPTAHGAQISAEDIQVIGQNQYGFSSCGIACDSNAHNYVEGFFDSRDRLKHDDFEVNASGFTEIKPDVKRKSVGRYSIVEDAVNRSFLHLELQKSDQLRTEIAARVPTSSTHCSAQTEEVMGLVQENKGMAHPRERTYFQVGMLNLRERFVPRVILTLGMAALAGIVWYNQMRFDQG